MDMSYTLKLIFLSLQRFIKCFLQCIYHTASQCNDRFHHQVTNMKDKQLAQALERIGKTVLDFDGRKCPPVRYGDCVRGAPL